MFKRCVLAAMAAMAFGMAHAGVDDDFTKQSIDATRPLPVDLRADGSLVPSDLTFDASFSGDGMHSVWPASETGWLSTEDGLRVFPWVAALTLPGGVQVPTHAGYYLIGKQKNSAGDSWRGFITRVSLAGETDTGFGTNGWIFTIGQDDIVDAAVAGDRAYILSNIWSGTGAPAVTRVICIDLTTPNGSSCFPALGGVQTWGATTAGPRTAAYGQRLVHDSRYGLFVAARVMSSDHGQQFGIARISADTGALNTGFGDGGYRIDLPTWNTAGTGSEIRINDLAVVPSGYPGGERLYIAGQLKINATDHDGVILGISPTSGETAAGWDWHSYYYELDNTVYRKDSVTAITVLRNGKVAFAGWSETDNAEVTPMMLGRIDIDGDYDTTFCAGNPDRGNRGCRMDLPGPYYAPVSLPVAIAERRQNRDLVVAERFQNNEEHNGDYHIFQAVRQFGASGNLLHARQALDYSANPGITLWSRPFGMWLGGSGMWNTTSNTGLGAEVIAVVGTRLWNGPDFDATISHLVATDSLFADTFGGNTSD